MFNKYVIIFYKMLLVILLSNGFIFVCYLWVLPILFDTYKKTHPMTFAHPTIIGYLPFIIVICSSALLSGSIIHKFINTNKIMSSTIKWLISVLTGTLVAIIVVYISFFIMLNTKGS